MSEWISVFEKLTPNGVDVLVFRPLAKETNDPIICVSQYTNQAKYSPQKIRHSFDCWCHPTHWMPLPEPPKD